MTYKQIYQELKKKIKKDYGRQCPQFQYGCVVCDMYMALTIIEDAVQFEEEKEDHG